LDVRLSNEQLELQAVVKRIAAASDAGPPLADQFANSKMAETAREALVTAGLFALLVPESAGGAGATAVEAALVAEQLAIGGAAAPYVGQAVLAPAILAAAGATVDAEQVGSGELRCTVRLAKDLRDFGDPDRPGVAIDAFAADYALCIGSDGGVWLHRLEADVPLSALDLTRVSFESVTSGGRTVGNRAIDEPSMNRLRALAYAVLSADLVGVAQRALDLSVAYVAQRSQFGHPVGSFQALQHLLADAAVLTESSRSAMWHAAWAVDALPSETAMLAGRQAKAYCGQAAVTVVEIAIQCHGGIGITWEHPLHLMLRRVLTDNQMFGDPRTHFEAIAALRTSSDWESAAESTPHEKSAPLGLDFGDSGDELAFRLRLRKWLVESGAAEAEPVSFDSHGGNAAHEWWERLAAAGWVGLSFPVENGGAGLSPTYDLLLNDELGMGGAPPAPPINHIANAIRLFGGASQKSAHLPGLLTCKVRWCQGFSEPNAGSDLAGLTTRGELFNDNEGVAHYRVSGQKIWTSDAVWAQWCLLLLRTEPDLPRHRGLSMLLVPMDAPGIEVRPIVTAYGSEEFAEVFFDDVHIPATHMLGQPGQGWEIAMALLGFERGPADMGWTSRLYRQLTEIEGGVRSGRLACSAAQKEALGEAWVAVETLRIHVQRSTSARLDGSAPGPEGSLDKLLVTAVDQKLNHVVLDILGPEAVLDDALAFPGYIWSRAQSIFGGTQQVQRNIVAQRVLGLPSK
jgi:alkylation response protein AidB-like acyl-CoA dehydrogenase